jgi:hypothetical protein
MLMSGAVVLPAVLLTEWVCGYPRWLLARIGHPVMGMGALIAALERISRRRGGRRGGRRCGQQCSGQNCRCHARAPSGRDPVLRPILTLAPNVTGQIMPRS